MKAIGSRKRVLFKSGGERIKLIIRRMCCLCCGTIHHELPDLVVPYKRYSSASIESALNREEALVVASDDSTIYRWRKWFQTVAWEFYSVLNTLAIRSERPLEAPPEASDSLLRIYRQLTEAGPGWLSRVVHLVVNTHVIVNKNSPFMAEKIPHPVIQ